MTEENYRLERIERLLKELQYEDDKVRIDREEALLCASHIHVTAITKGLYSNRALHELVGKGLMCHAYNMGAG